MPRTIIPNDLSFSLEDLEFLECLILDSPKKKLIKKKFDKKKLLKKIINLKNKAKRFEDSSKEKPVKKRKQRPVKSKYINLFPDKFTKSKTFTETWKDWEQFRIEIKFPLTETMVTRQVNKLSKYPIEEAIEMLELSITNGWRGLWALKTSAKKKRTHKGPSKYDGLETEL